MKYDKIVCHLCAILWISLIVNTFKFYKTHKSIELDILTRTWAQFTQLQINSNNSRTSSTQY